MKNMKDKFYRIELDDKCRVYVDGRLLKVKKGEFLYWWVKSVESPFDHSDSKEKERDL